jgi:hypothetical protein
MNRDPRVSAIAAFRLLNDSGNDYHYDRSEATTDETINEERGDAEWCGQGCRR